MKKILILTATAILAQISSFAIAGEPVFRLLSFTCSPVSENNDLTWTTSGEMNVVSFVVEKSTDAVNYLPIASLSANNTNGVQTYRFTDDKVMDGTASFYRLKTTGKDGGINYSTIVALTARNNTPVGYSITVVKNALNLEAGDTARENISMHILNDKGITVFKKYIVPNEWVNGSILIPAEFLSAGLYTCVFHENNKEFGSLKFKK